jgi:DNA-binding CsgD family transcriptional regulator
MFASTSAEALAERTAREQLATGETVRKRTLETLNELTAQEALIARLARDGLPNREIGSQLFIGPRTVEYHLTTVFTKLDISRRNQLDRVLLGDPTPPRWTKRIGQSRTATAEPRPDRQVKGTGRGARGWTTDRIERADRSARLLPPARLLPCG